VNSVSRRLALASRVPEADDGRGFSRGRPESSSFPGSKLRSLIASADHIEKRRPARKIGRDRAIDRLKIAVRREQASFPTRANLVPN